MEKIIICPTESKLNILNDINNQNQLHNIKFYTKQEFIDNYFFSYNDNSLFYLMSKYKMNIDVAKVYLKNLYYIDENKIYKNNKLEFLKNIKQELIDNKLIEYNDIFRKYIKNKQIEVINYYDFDKYLEKILNYKVDIPESKFNKKIYEFQTIEEEVNYVCIEIRKLLKKGIDINKIYLVNISDEYNYIISKLFKYYNIPLNINYKDSIYATPVVQEYLKTKKLDLENSNNSSINKKIINILGSLVDIDENNELYNIILIDKLKNTYLNPIKYENAVNIRDLDEMTFKEDEYVFVLGFNLNSIPKVYQDIDYISDKDKSEVDLYDTNYLNKREKQKTIYLLEQIKNLTITYKLSTPFQKYYPSTLINDLSLEIIKDTKDDYNYSDDYNKIRLAEYLDKYYIYGISNDNLDLLYNNYKINYNTYDNKYTGIDNNKYLESLPYPLRLSYTSINTYNECKFKYYINNVLKLGDYTKTFATYIGSMYHYILTLYKKTNFDFELEFNKYLEQRDLTLKEKILLVKIKKDLINLIDVIKNQNLITGYDNEVYEKEARITLKKDVSVEFVGYIDKIMFYKNIDDTYFSIIDYKTGTIDTNISLMKYGLHMQLPIYLYLINYSDIFDNPIFTGIYYQNILFNYPTWSKSLEKDINDRYLLKGYSTDNCDILERFDPTYEDSKLIKSMKYNPEKGFSSYTKLINDNEMIDMVKYIDKTINNSVDDILKSDFTINPKMYEGKNISCKYCQFNDLCFMKNDDLVYLDKVEDFSFLGGDC